jgi:hypothetical protein
MLSIKNDNGSPSFVAWDGRLHGFVHAVRGRAHPQHKASKVHVAQLGLQQLLEMLGALLPLPHRLHQDGLGEYIAPGLPLAFDGKHPAGVAAPALGGDTVAVLTERLGLSTADIERLTNAHTIGR